jgi:hypothetical protein
MRFRGLRERTHSRAAAMARATIAHPAGESAAHERGPRRGRAGPPGATGFGRARSDRGSVKRPGGLRQTGVTTGECVRDRRPRRAPGPRGTDVACHAGVPRRACAAPTPRRVRPPRHRPPRALRSNPASRTLPCAATAVPDRAARVAREPISPARLEPADPPRPPLRRCPEPRRQDGPRSPENGSRSPSRRGESRCPARSCRAPGGCQECPPGPPARARARHSGRASA